MADVLANAGICKALKNNKKDKLRRRLDILEVGIDSLILRIFEQPFGWEVRGCYLATISKTIMNLRISLKELQCPSK